MSPEAPEGANDKNTLAALASSAYDDLVSAASKIAAAGGPPVKVSRELSGWFVKMGAKKSKTR